MTKLPSSLQNNAFPDVSVVTVSYNTEHLLARMLSALTSCQGSLRLQLIVIDNASRDGSTELIKNDFPNVELIENSHNVGFGRANNQALPLVRGRYVLLLNTDAFVSSDTILKTVNFMDEHRRCGVLGVKLVGEDGALQPSCRYFPTPWNVFLQTTGLWRLFPKARLIDDMSWDHESVRACDWVPGCYYLIRREMLDQVGLFDPRYFLYCEEVDHCRRVREAGWDVIYYPNTHVVHIGGESAKSSNPVNSYRQISSLQIESELLYFRKFHGLGGVLTSVILTVLADIVIAIKGFVRRRDAATAKAAMMHARSVIETLIKTDWASKSTR